MKTSQFFSNILKKKFCISLCLVLYSLFYNSLANSASKPRLSETKKIENWTFPEDLKCNKAPISPSIISLIANVQPGYSVDIRDAGDFLVDFWVEECCGFIITKSENISFDPFENIVNWDITYSRSNIKNAVNADQTATDKELLYGYNTSYKYLATIDDRHLLFVQYNDYNCSASGFFSGLYFIKRKEDKLIYDGQIYISRGYIKNFKVQSNILTFDQIEAVSDIEINTIGTPESACKKFSDIYYKYSVDLNSKKFFSEPKLVSIEFNLDLQSVEKYIKDTWNDFELIFYKHVKQYLQKGKKKLTLNEYNKFLAGVKKEYLALKK